jgi:spermidine synthase
MLLDLVKRYVLELTVFVCGAVVMVYEIIGSRIVSPFIGTSTYVWTSLIGVILASLSLGYWLGGKLADRRPEVKILAFVVFVAGGLVSMTILIKDVVLAAVASTPTGLELKSVFAAILLFAPASVALGFVTPLAIRLKMTAVKDSGSTVGRLYALSTIGSIAGTFAAGFILVPFVGSTRTLYLIAGVLFLISILLAPFAFSRTTLSVLIVFALGIMGNELTNFYQLHTVGLRDVDTEYSRVQIFQATDSRTGRPMRAMMTDPYFVQSVIYLDGEDLFARYTHFYHLLRHLRPGFQKSLMIGGAGYSFPQDYLRNYPHATIDVVEIDSAMTDIAREHFRLQENPRLRIFHDDGRVFLNRSESGVYDAVLMDAFGSLFSVPHHLTTVEAVRQIDRLLDPDGVVIFNMGSALTGESSRFLRAELATYRSVFPLVYVFKVNSDSTDERTQNVMIVACKTACSVGSQATTDDPEISRLLSHRYADDIPLDVPILTDDLSPVEYYNSFAQSQRRR